MVYICSELWVGNRHGYRLVSDNFETLDAPDSSVNQLISRGKLDIAFKTMELPVHTKGGRVVGGRKLVVLGRNDFEVICADYTGAKKVLTEAELDDWEYINGHVVEFVRLGGIPSKTVQLYNETYKNVVDSYYNDNIMDVDTEAVQKAQIKAEMVQGFYRISERGVLYLSDNVEAPKIFKIPNGVKSTDTLDGFTKLIGCESLVELTIGQANEEIDLSKCDNLATVKIESTWYRNPSYTKNIIWNKATANIEGTIRLDPEVGEFTDWPSLRLRSGMFDKAIMNKLALGNSYAMQETFKSMANNAQIHTIELGGNIKKIGARTFIGTGFSDIIIGDSIEEIGEEAFYSIYAKEGSLYGCKNVTKVGKSAFGECIKTTIDLSIFKNLRSIGTGAFNSCKSATSRIVLGESLRVVGTYALPKADVYVLSSNLTDKSISNLLRCGSAKILEIPRKFEKLIENIFAGDSELEYIVKSNDLEIKFIGG